MNNNSPVSGTWGLFVRWITGWRLVALTALVSSFTALGLLTLQDGDVDSVRLLIRITARVSLGFFCLAFSATAANRIWPNGLTRWQVANRRYLGLSFAVSHLIHAVAITIFIGYYAREFHEVHPGSNVPGGIGYLFLLAMTVTSFNRTAALVGTRLWRVLHATGAYVLWTIFLISEVSRVHAGPVHLWFAVPLLLVAGIRLFAWWRLRTGTVSGPTAERTSLPPRPTVPRTAPLSHVYSRRAPSWLDKCSAPSFGTATARSERRVERITPVTRFGVR